MFGFPTGRTRGDLMSLAGKICDVPDLRFNSDDAGFIIECYQNIRQSCGDGYHGPMPVTPSMISEWQAMTGDYIMPEFRAILVEMDAEYRRGMADTSAYFEKRNK